MSGYREVDLSSQRGLGLGRRLIKMVDAASEGTGKWVCWAIVILIVFMGVELTARYAFHSPTLWSYELSCMLLLVISVMGLAFTERHHGHVRVDVVYIHLGGRTQAIIDTAGYLLFFFPFIIGLSYGAISHMWFSWSVNETLYRTPWNPPAAPIKTVLVLGLLLFLFQGTAEFIRVLYFAVKGKAL